MWDYYTYFWSCDKGELPLDNKDNTLYITFDDISLNVIARERAQVAEMAEMGRFTEPALLILTSLASGPKHGYAMMEDIERLTGTRLGPGTLYGALARLEQTNYITSIPSDERRQPYQLTPEGCAVLQEQLTRMQSFAAAGLARLGGLA